ncbi:uncharacterized protein C8Q71DRAFT_853036 [Rhodofomes roseus]|uniref:Integrase core domain-containing protein n=1 Tax=Rhodofomes roseus TaxID=34475 RepID=A0ABQ8KUY1_9APHY|nr:uncharacterized protein C8Q71DRAFT_853036 [Rhodofomes roseus]KAH9842488.1 hypothetical protein C8Q71DRAFT_853036 [Rhodofomes roseus]
MSSFLLAVLEHVKVPPPLPVSIPDNITVDVSDGSADLPSHMLAVCKKDIAEGECNIIATLVAHECVWGHQLTPAQITIPIVPLSLLSPEHFRELMGYIFTVWCFTAPADIIRGHVTYYYTLGLSDSKIAESCQQHFNTEVYGLSNTTVKRLRAQWNLPKTRQQNHTAVSIDPYCRALKARYPTYGARQMTSTLRITYNIRVSESMVGKWLKEFEPNAVQARKHRKFKRHQFWAAGVNDVWAFDQHDKWARFGLFLHLCIEPVAGEIKWLKIWWNNSNPRLITSYYLEAVRSIGAVPLVTQSDPGSENFGIANAQTYMRHTLDPTLADTLQHRWMRGHMNIKPEIMWSVLNRSWKPGFEAKLQYGIDNGWYNPANELETLVFRWLAIPWLQAELDAWALHFNSTPRRASKHKVLPQGIPTMIAQNPAAFNVVDFKIPVPADLVDEVEELWAPPDHPVFECVPPYIAGKLEEAIEALGRPAISMETFWAIYLQVLEYIRKISPSELASTPQHSQHYCKYL